MAPLCRDEIRSMQPRQETARRVLDGKWQMATMTKMAGRQRHWIIIKVWLETKTQVCELRHLLVPHCDEFYSRSKRECNSLTIWSNNCPACVNRPSASEWSTEISGSCAKPPWYPAANNIEHSKGVVCFSRALQTGTTHQRL